MAKKKKRHFGLLFQKWPTMYILMTNKTILNPNSRNLVRSMKIFSLFVNFGTSVFSHTHLKKKRQNRNFLKIIKFHALIGMVKGSTYIIKG